MYFGDDDYFGDYGADAAADLEYFDADTVETSNSKENTMSAGTRFNTSNAVVRELPVGSVLEVVGPGEVLVVDVPAASFEAGDRISTKYGPATVVRLTRNQRKLDDPDKYSVLFVADSDPVLRAARPEKVNRF